MYKSVLKQIDEGIYNSKAEKKYENLYQDFKLWGKAKSPTKLTINIDQNPTSNRIVAGWFSQSRIVAPKFDPSSPTDYFKRVYAGGPVSNVMKTSKIDQSKRERSAMVIQK